MGAVRSRAIQTCGGTLNLNFKKIMKIVFNAMMPNREVSDMIGKAVNEYAKTGIFPDDLIDLFTVEIKSIDGNKVAIVNPA